MSSDPSAPLADLPVRLVLADDLRRSRLTVFFRLVLAIPLIILYLLWSIGVFFTAIAAWFVVLVQGRLGEGLHGFLASYVRFAIRMNAYIRLIANPFPGFDTDARYDVDVEIDGPRPQRRWTVLVRIFLAIPALLLTAATGGAGGGSFGWRSGGRWSGGFSAGGTGTTVAILGWFAALARGRMPRGLRDLGAYGLAYSAQTMAYVLLLTDRYPTADPRIVGPMELPEHPVRLELTDSLSRRRLLVFFRILLVLPHVVWLALWTVAAVLAAIAGWVAAVFTGRLPDTLHRFLAAYVRYGTHLNAFIHLVGGPFPGFAGTEGSYPVDIRIAPSGRQRRWVVVFRAFLAIPAFVLASAYGGVMLGAAFLGWFAALARGSMPLGLRNIGAAGVRYQAQTWAYFLLLTARYPYACPALEDTATAEPDSSNPALLSEPDSPETV
jgi:hypothetical protein